MLVPLRAHVTRAFNSSMEVRIDVDAEDVPTGHKFESNSAYFTFVALDATGKPTDVPEVETETETEKELYNGALETQTASLDPGRKNETSGCEGVEGDLRHAVEV